MLLPIFYAQTLGLFRFGGLYRIMMNLVILPLKDSHANSLIFTSSVSGRLIKDGCPSQVFAVQVLPCKEQQDDNDDD